MNLAFAAVAAVAFFMACEFYASLSENQKRDRLYAIDTYTFMLCCITLGGAFGAMATQ